MKSRSWAILLASILVVCIGISVALMNGKPAARAEISSNGEVVQIVDLRIDQEFTVTAPDGGSNTITVRDGKIAVTYADCPDGYCVQRGFCNSGTQIVCLPHRLVIRFLDEQKIDGVVG